MGERCFRARASLSLLRLCLPLPPRDEKTKKKLTVLKNSKRNSKKQNNRDTKSGKCVSEVKNLHSAQVTSVSVSVDGATLLTCGRDSCLRVSDARSLKPKTPTKAGSSPSSSSSSANSSPCPPMTDPAFAVTSVWCSAALGPDAKHAAAASGDGSGLFVWETDTGKRVRRLTTTTMSSSAVGALAVSWSPQGSPLVCCDRGGGGIAVGAQGGGEVILMFGLIFQKSFVLRFSLFFIFAVAPARM